MAKQLLLDNEEFMQSSQDDGRESRVREARATALNALGQDSSALDELLKSESAVAAADGMFVDAAVIPAEQVPANELPDSDDVRPTEAPRQKRQWVTDDFIWQDILGDPNDAKLEADHAEARNKRRDSVRKSDAIAKATAVFAAWETNPDIRPQAVNDSFKVKVRHRGLLSLFVLVALAVLLSGGWYFMQQDNAATQLQNRLEQGVDSLQQLNLEALLSLKDKVLAQLKELGGLKDSDKNAEIEAKMAGLRERLELIRLQARKAQALKLRRENQAVIPPSSTDVVAQETSAASVGSADFEERLGAQVLKDDTSVSFEERMQAQAISSGVGLTDTTGPARDTAEAVGIETEVPVQGP